MPKYTYEYPRPAASVDCLVLALDEEILKILLIRRGKEPFKGCWALPGGFLDMHENLDVAAKRELQEETGLTNVSLQQIHTFGDVDRDPRGRVLTVAFLAMLRMADHDVQAADDADDAKWFSIRRLPKLAFDHRGIINVLIERLRLGLRCQPFGLELLPREFKLDQLRNLYETVLGRNLEAGKFRSRILKSGLLVSMNNKNRFRFDRQKYRAALKNGITIGF